MEGRKEVTRKENQVSQAKKEKWETALNLKYLYNYIHIYMGYYIHICSYMFYCINIICYILFHIYLILNKNIFRR